MNISYYVSVNIPYYVSVSGFGGFLYENGLLEVNTKGVEDGLSDETVNNEWKLENSSLLEAGIF